jgi:hypothetical protein
MPRSARLLLLQPMGVLLLPALAYAQDAHAAIQSSRGVQHKAPLISDDLIVGCIMIMFLLLFAFGKSCAAQSHPSAQCTSFARTLTSSRHCASFILVVAGKQ